jgi:hypothetical protein
VKTISREEFAGLVREARIKTRLKRDLRFVPEEITDWELRDFLAVTNRSGSEGVLVAPLGKLYVLPFELHRRTANYTGRIEAIICDFCATWQRGSNSATITFYKDKSSVSFLCCADLLCSLHVRGKTSAATLSRTQLREQISPEARIVRLHDRLERILVEIK